METKGTTMEELRTMESIQSINRKLPDLELRDLFAMNAMTGFHRGSLWTGGDWDGVAERCYKLADAMLEARRK